MGLTGVDGEPIFECPGCGEMVTPSQLYECQECGAVGCEEDIDLGYMVCFDCLEAEENE